VLSKSPVAAIGYETSLSDQWRGRQLADAVKLLYNFLPVGATHATHPDRVKRLTWPLTDYERSLKSYSSVKGQQTNLSHRYFTCFAEVTVIQLAYVPRRTRGELAHCRQQASKLHIVGALEGVQVLQSKPW